MKIYRRVSYALTKESLKPHFQTTSSTTLIIKTPISFYTSYLFYTFLLFFFLFPLNFIKFLFKSSEILYHELHIYEQEGITITEELSHENLSHLIEHWIEHNESHIDSFKEWAQRAKKDGFLQASEDILEAAKKMEEANDSLNRARSGLFNVE